MEGKSGPKKSVFILGHPTSVNEITGYSSNECLENRNRNVNCAKNNVMIKMQCGSIYSVEDKIEELS